MTEAGHVAAFQVLWSRVVHRRGELSDRFTESAVPQVELGLAPRPAQVQMAGFLGEPAAQSSRDRGRALPVEVVSRGVPDPLAVGQYGEQLLDGMRARPALDLLVDPVRRRCARGGQEDEVA